MNISDYKVLISNLPVRQQSFITKRPTWENAEADCEWFKNLNNELYGSSKTLTISRQDIFETKELRDIIIKTIFWGYTGGMRGNNFANILKNIVEIERILKPLQQKDGLTNDNFNILVSEFQKIKGISLSTYSKLLYFLNISFNNLPCLVLDQRIIDVLANKIFDDFSIKGIKYENAEKHYLLYLQLAKSVAISLETKEENIEHFLFTFGKNLKY